MTAMNLKAVVLTMDVERGWGLAEALARPAPSAETLLMQLRNSRSRFPKVLATLEEYEIKMTFAVVTGLLTGVADLEGSINDRAWQEHFKCVETIQSRFQDEMLFRGDQEIASIRDSSVGHEIASHSHTHPLFSRITEAAATFEFEETRRALRVVGSAPVSFVFPQNAVRYASTAAQKGFEAYRDVSTIQQLSGTLSRELRLPDISMLVHETRLRVVGHPPLSNPFLRYGMLGVRKSIGLRATRFNPAKGIPPAVGEGLRSLQVRGGVLHLVLHDFDLGTDEAMSIFESVIHQIGEARRAGIEVLTMKDVAEKCGLGRADS